MQVKHSGGQLGSLALSEELDTPDKRTTALAGRFTSMPAYTLHSHAPCCYVIMCCCTFTYFNTAVLQTPRFVTCQGSHCEACVNFSTCGRGCSSVGLPSTCRYNADFERGWLIDWLAVRELPSAHRLPLRASRIGGEGSRCASRHQGIRRPYQRLRAQRIRHRAVGGHTLQEQAHMAKQAGSHCCRRPGIGSHLMCTALYSECERYNHFRALPVIIPRACMLTWSFSSSMEYSREDETSMIWLHVGGFVEYASLPDATLSAHSRS